MQCPSLGWLQSVSDSYIPGLCQYLYDQIEFHRRGHNIRIQTLHHTVGAITQNTCSLFEMHAPTSQIGSTLGCAFCAVTLYESVLQSAPLHDKTMYNFTQNDFITLLTIWGDLEQVHRVASFVVVLFRDSFCGVVFGHTH
jgi:hypothetical protein